MARFIGGVQAGYEHYFPSKLMLGIELDASLPDYLDLAPTLSYRATGTGTASEELEWLMSLRGRVGYDMGGWTPFVTGGIAWASTRFSRIDLTTGNEDANPSNVRLGYVLGGGVDFRLDSRWSARAEYLYTNLGLTGFAFASAPARYDLQYDLHRLRVGLNYKFGEVDDSKDKRNDRGPGSWELHGQTAFVYQGYPPFSAPYDGPQSLPAGGQSRETWAVSAFLGVRLWEGGEFYYNPELLQGFGVANTQGAGGFPNGEAQRAFPYPLYSTSRLFVRQTIGLGGEREKVDSDFGQLAGKRDVSRVTIQAGRYAVQDIFDNNSYANDPRVDFLNWSIWAAGAFDYAADSVGYTWGVAAELNQPNWAVRLGYFLEPAQTDTNVFDLALFVRGGYVGELEMRFQPYDRPGAVRLGAWLNSSFAGWLQRRRGARCRQSRPVGQRHHPAHPPGPHQVRLLSQPRAGAQRQCRRLRALELERRPHRDHVLHRHRQQHIGRSVDQGHAVGPAERHDRHRRRAQLDLGRPCQLPGGRRARHPGGRRRAHLRPGGRRRDLLFPARGQGPLRHGRLPVPRQSRLQRRARTGALLQRAPAGAFLIDAVR